MRNLLLLPLAAYLLIGTVSSQSLQCPLYPLANVSSNDNDTLIFAPFPTDSPSTNVEYDPGALGPWYSISSGIINVARPGSFTEDILVPLLGDNITSFSSSLPEPSMLLTDITRWWAGIIALTVLGGLLSFCFCFCCICFSVCRCCGKCGGNLKQEETNYTNCLTIVFTVILILFVCGLMAGIVLSFFSNQRVYDSVNEFEDTISDTFTLAENFVNDSVLKVDTLLCQLNDTLDITVDQARGLLRQVDSVVNNFGSDVYSVVDRTINLSSALEAVQNTLTNMSTSVTALQMSSNTLNTTLQNISVSVMNLSMQCNSIPGSPVDCTALDPTVFQNGLDADYTQLPNITGELQNVQNLLGEIDLTDLAKQGNDTFNSALSELRNFTGNADTELNAAVDTLRVTVFNTSDTIRSIANNITGSSGYIDDAREVVTDGFNLIRGYDTPRYAVGIIISCSSIVVVILVFIGLICGLCGFRTDRAPYERTDLSNCGGVTLIFAAIMGFLFGAFLMLLAALVFFSGGILEKFCNDLERPDYILINNTVDNPSLNGGEYLLSQFILQNGSIRLAFSDILNNCSGGNTTVFQALKLNDSSYFQTVVNFSNISQLVPDVSGEVSGFASNISDLISRDTFVPQDVQDRLNGFNGTGVGGINITQFTEQLNRAILSFNVTEQIEQLTQLRDNFNNTNTMQGRDLADQTDGIISQLMTIDDTTAAIQGDADNLTGLVTVLQNNTMLLQNGVNDLLTSINQTFDRLIDNGINPLVDSIETVFPRAIGYGQQLVDHALHSLENEVGNCYPAYAVYTGFYNAACEFTLDGLNGFWLALGMCAVFLIPIIIFSIVVSQYYRRMKFEEDLGVLPFDDSFPLKENKRY